MIYVIADLRLKPGTTEKTAGAARQVVAETVKEDGCTSYDFYVSVSDPTKLVAVERWESKEKLAAHGQTDHIKAWRAASGDAVVSRVIEVISPADVERR